MVAHFGRLSAHIRSGTPDSEQAHPWRPRWVACVAWAGLGSGHPPAGMTPRRWSRPEG